MQKNNCFHLYVSGRVQGVGFRWFTKKLAQKLEIKGWVKNLDDGRVEIAARADNDEILKNFIEKIKEGSMLSKVNNVEVNWVCIKDEFKKFEIR